MRTMKQLCTNFAEVLRHAAALAATILLFTGTRLAMADEPPVESAVIEQDGNAPRLREVMSGFRRAGQEVPSTARHEP